MSDGTSHANASYVRHLVGIALPLATLFVLAGSIGFASVFLLWVAITLAVASLAFHTVGPLTPRIRRPLAGSAKVIAASAPPPGVAEGRCELQLIVEIPGRPAASHTIRDPAVPIAKWPVAGTQLPVQVQRHDPREISVRWDKVRGHAAAAADLEFVDRITTRAKRTAAALPQPRAAADDELGSYLDELFTTEPDTDEPDPPPAPTAAPAPAEPETPSAFQPLDLPEFDVAKFFTTEVPDPPALPLPRREPAPAPLEGARWAALQPMSTPEDQLAGRVLDPGVLTSGRAAYDAETHGPAETDADPESGPGDEAATIQGVGVSLLVTDLPRSVEFYRDTLGFTELDCGSGAAVLAAGEAKLLLRQDDDDPHPDGHRRSHVNLEVDDVQAVYEDLRAKGVKFLQRPRAVASTALLELWSVSFRDPDGHGLALTSWRYRA